MVLFFFFFFARDWELVAFAKWHIISAMAIVLLE
jgi:hypothetical protein